MNNPNIGWLYYKDYLRKNGDPTKLFLDVKLMDEESRKDHFDQHFNGFEDDQHLYHQGKNQNILSQQFNTRISEQLSVVAKNPQLTFKSVYPGLTMGTGYSHETGEMGEFKLGFFFDYATGYPCIPGSTIKGCLRAIFPQKNRDKIGDKIEKYHYLASAIREIPDLPTEIIIKNDLGKEFDKVLTDNRIRFIDILEREIFDGEKPLTNEDGSYKLKKTEFEYQSLCVYDRDIFFDGYILSSDHPAIKRSTYRNPKPFIADDFITPHLNRKRPELSPFTNPVPLMFLKILPEVTIQLQFNLKNGIILKQAKEALFRRILLDFGVGAKTNVGYGQFEQETADSQIKEEESFSERITIKRDPANFSGRIAVGKILEGIVINSNTREIKIKVNDLDVKTIMSGYCPKEGTLVNTRVCAFDKSGKITLVSYQGDVRQ